MARVTPFSIGQRWFCKGRDGDFYFVIIGKGKKVNIKLCRLEYVDPKNHRAHGLVQAYSHDHLKEYATLVTEKTAPTTQVDMIKMVNWEQVPPETLERVITILKADLVGF